MKQVRKIVIIGSQGSGKGTQAEKIAKNCGVAHISTGNLLRKETESNSDLGKQALQCMSKGKLVPDALMNKILDKHINGKEAQRRGFILDGYPRNRAQQKALSRITDLSEVLVIEITDQEAIQRIGGRLVGRDGRTFHKIYNPPPKEVENDVCAREDDKPEAVKKRLKIYHDETEPVIQEYEKQGIVKRVDGMGSIEEVYRLVLEKLGLKC